MSRRLNLLHSLNRVDSVTQPKRSWGLLIEMGAVCLFVVGGLIGLCWIFCFSIYPEWRLLRDFQRTTCEVVTTRVGQKASGAGSVCLYRPEIQIEYNVGHVQYKTWAYDFNMLNDEGYYFTEKEARKGLEPFTSGKTYYCWYDPDKASRAVLFQSWTFSNVWILVVPLSFLLLGVGPLIHLSVFHWGRSREKAAHLAQQTGLANPIPVEIVCASDYTLTQSGKLALIPDQTNRSNGTVGKSAKADIGVDARSIDERSVSGTDPRSESDWETDSPEPLRIVFPAIPSAKEIMDSPGVRLKYRLPLDNSPLWSMSVLGGACLVWNFLVLMFLSVAIGCILDGQPDWGLVLFVVPFLIVGFVLIGYFLYKIQDLTAVGPTLLEISDMPLVPGQTANVLLIQTGVHQFKSLTVKLVCEEEVVFSYGTDIRVESATIYSQEILSCYDFAIVSEENWERTLSISIPEFAMHSFEAPHNRVRWRLVVEGVVENVAPFTRRFSLVVVPELDNVGA